MPDYVFWLVILFCWLVVAALAAQVAEWASAKLRQRRDATAWRERKPHDRPIIYLDARMAVGAEVLGRRVPQGYRLASLFFGVGLIDRTRRLDHGFSYEVLDPIPALDGVPAGGGPTLAELCDARGAELVALSRRSGRPIRLFWSGGIDSTAACIALLKALDEGERDRLEVVFSKQSVKEYRRFHGEFIKRLPKRIKVSRVGKALREDRINVTGEHGDQLFGSVKALGLPFEALRTPWETALPQLLRTQLATTKSADTVLRYLAPQFGRCPVPLPNLFELLWWMNFSLKWQAVSLRMLTSTNLSRWPRLEPTLAHFYRTEDFQRWSLTHPGKRIGDTMASYKWPLKDYIRDFTGDADYHADKQKEPSLRGVLISQRKGMGLAVDADRRAFLQPFDDSLRDRRDVESVHGTGAGNGGGDNGGSGSGRGSVAIGYECEQSTWDVLSDSDGGE